MCLNIFRKLICIPLIIALLLPSISRASITLDEKNKAAKDTLRTDSIESIIEPKPLSSDENIDLAVKASLDSQKIDTICAGDSQAVYGTIALLVCLAILLWIVIEENKIRDAK